MCWKVRLRAHHRSTEPFSWIQDTKCEPFSWIQDARCEPYSLIQDTK